MELDFQQKLTRMIDGILIVKNEKKEALACLETLEIIVKNLVNFPEEAKYKTIKEKSKALQRVLNCVGGQDLLVFLGGLKKAHQFESHFVWDAGMRIKDLELAAALPIINFYKTKLMGVPQESLKDKLKREEAAKNQILKEIQFDRIERLERIEQQRIAREMATRNELEKQREKTQKQLTDEEESELLERRQKLAGRMGLPSVKQGEQMQQQDTLAIIEGQEESPIAQESDEDA